MTIQHDLWGNAHNLLNTEAKVERILREHPYTRGLDKQLIVKLWLEEDGLAELLGEDLASQFEQWFCSQATYTESITRTRRQLQAEGEYLPEDEHLARRGKRQAQFRRRYRQN